MCSHPEVWDTFQALAGRAMDGGALLEYLLADASHHAYDGVAGIASGRSRCARRSRAALSGLGRKISDPAIRAGGRCVGTRSPRLSVRGFGAAAGRQRKSVRRRELLLRPARLVQPRLGQEHHDARQSPRLRQPPAWLADQPFTTIPIPVSFSGMPNTRWWTFEDHATNFGDIDASTTDLPSCSLWSLRWCTRTTGSSFRARLPSGALAQVKGLAVTNVFGERLWIEAADQGADNAWGRWTMFTINIRNAPAGSARPTRRCSCLPTLPATQPGPAQEEVFLVRDEVADMAWGIEKTVPLASGISRPGSEVAKQTFNYLQSLVAGGRDPASACRRRSAIRP